MRFIRTMLTAAGLSLATGMTAMAAPPASLQDTLRVEVQTSESQTVWYTDPVWLAIGGIVLVLVIVLIVMAVRGRSSTTTVVR